MKKYIYYALVAVLAVTALSSCKEKALDPDSIITVGSKTQNDFDKWLENNYVNPYNILVKYRYEMNESDYNYYTIPADMDCSIILAHLVKYLCIDSYDEVAGVDFTRQYFPKMFFYIGEWEYRNNGTFILGTAEGGKKILLSGVNYIPLVLQGGYQGHTDVSEALNHFYIKTIHHEFTHILNQTKDFPSDFSQVTPTGYVTDSWSTPEYANNFERGFISTYAQHSDREDFAEMMSIYVTNSQETWDNWMTRAGASASLIRTKLDIVKNYMLNTFGIDLDQLRATVLRRQSEVVSGMVDLTSLEIN